MAKVIIPNIDNLLKDVKLKFWKGKIKRSIHSVLQLYDLSLDEISVARQKINPNELYVASEEECDLKTAREYLKKHTHVPPPITVIKYKGKKVLFMGSVRSVEFVLHKEYPDCIVVRLPDYVQSKIVSKAKHTLNEVIKKQDKVAL